LFFTMLSDSWPIKPMSLYCTELNSYDKIQQNLFIIKLVHVIEHKLY
jgi:hypothetical protein